MGMMHEGYFVGRKELTGWIQANFQPSFTKIEDLANGVVYCQIIDSVYPGSVPMSKVKMQARTEVDSIHNFKILQTAFSKKKIDRFIEVDKLCKRSFQFNMEFIQFMKCYWDMHAPNGEGGGPKEVFAEKQDAQSPANEQPTRKAEKPAAERAPGGAKRASTAGASSKTGAGARDAPAAGARDGGSSGAAQQQLALEVTELKMSVENLERERDFYYSKLREVEVLCQNHEGENVPFLQQVLDILYKTDDADEFITPDEAEPVAVA